MRLRRALPCTAAVIALLALTACGSDSASGSGDQGGGGDKDASATPSEPAKPAKPKGYEPPLKFEKAPGVELPKAAVGDMGTTADLPVSIDEGVVFISRPDGLEVSNGSQRSDPVLITPDGTPEETVASGDYPDPHHAEAPLISSVKGTKLALNAILVQGSGSGTALGQGRVEVLAADASDATRAWSAKLDLPGEAEEYRRGRTGVVGRAGGTLVVKGSGALMGLDLNTRKQVWTAEGMFHEAHVVGDTVVGVRAEPEDTGRTVGPKRGQVVGLSVADGEERWASSDTGSALYPAGADTVVSREGESTVFRDAARGEETGRTEGIGGRCAYDGVGVTVCHSAGAVVGYHPKSGKELWGLAEGEGRLVPQVTLVREGLIYGFTEENGPVILDASNGEDKETDPGAAPTVTDGRAAVVWNENAKYVDAYRTTG